MSYTLKNVQTVSVEGNEVFNFPNINLAPGKILYIVSGSDALSSANSIEWTKNKFGSIQGTRHN